MKQSRMTVSVLLMISSIILLVLLQVLWLHNAYEKAYLDLGKETSILFRNTVYALRDSALMKGIVPLRGDSSMGIFHRSMSSDSVAFAWSDSLRPPSAGFRNQVTSIEIVSSDIHAGDSLQHDVIRRLAPRLRESYMTGGDGQRRFVIRLGPDTLNPDTLKSRFRAVLADKNVSSSPRFYHRVLSVPLMRTRSPFPAPDLKLPDGHTGTGEYGQLYQDTLMTEFIPVNPVHQYAVTLTGIRGIVVREITPQIAFSVFLTSLTCVSFFFLYRNIRSQKRLMEIKNDFINNVTHELKTPIATVSVALEALKHFNVTENPVLTKEYLEMAQRELSRLSMMTDKILKTSVYENNGIDFVPEKVDLDQVVNQVLLSLKLMFDKHRAKVEYQKEGNSFVLQGSPVHLTNLVYNLVDNALKYSQENPLITVTLHETPGALRLSIKDNGPGIPAEYHTKIFEKFFRVPTGDVHTTKGYGLGLNYVASVVRHHNGKIHVESAPGHGCTFVVTLPTETGTTR